MSKLVPIVHNLVISRDTLRLLRIPFSLYLAPVYLLALSQAPSINPFTAFCTFVILHFLVYPASNGYNSYVDKDEGSIGGLEKPPLPTSQLFYTTLVMDVSAILMSLVLVGGLFGLCVFIYILASRAYSAPQVRLKKQPLAGFLTVVFFQGAFTCFMALAGITGSLPQAGTQLPWLLLACSLQIAGAYPLTQVYQHSDDKQSGVETLSMKLGVRGTFVFTALMFVLCNLAYFVYFRISDKLTHFYLLQLFFLPLLLYFFWWFRKVWKNREAANFRLTMRMNLIAALCSGSCFILLTILNL